MHKPGDYKSERDFMHDLYTRANSCSRHYYLLWYDAYVRGAAARLPPPYWDGPVVPGRNETHDKLVDAWRIEFDVKPNKGTPCRQAALGHC